MPGDEYYFSKMFYTSFKMLTNKTLEKDNYRELEDTLVDAVKKVLGAKVILNYMSARDKKDLNSFIYTNEVSSLFENIIINYKKSDSIISHIKDYGANYLSETSKYRYANILLNSVYRLYSDQKENVIVKKFDDCHRIDPNNNNSGKIAMPSLFIDNIANLDKILENYIMKIEASDSYYKLIYSSDKSMLTDDIIADIFCYTLLNMNNNESWSLEEYFKKYTDFLDESIYTNILGKPKYVGELLDDNVYAVGIKKDIAYEAPYWLSFVLEKNRFLLPLVGAGIYKNDGEKVAEILAVQDSQSQPCSKEVQKEIIDKIKECSPKTHNFRQHNPVHLVSIILTMGFLNASNIRKIDICTYMPFRYQRQVLENRKSDEEIDDFQNRVGSKNLYTWLRALEFTDDYVIEDYPDSGSYLSIRLNENMKFNNEFFEEMYNIGYNAGKKANETKTKEI